MKRTWFEEAAMDFGFLVILVAPLFCWAAAAVLFGAFCGTITR